MWTAVHALFRPVQQVHEAFSVRDGSTSLSRERDCGQECLTSKLPARVRRASSLLGP